MEFRLNTALNFLSMCLNESSRGAAAYVDFTKQVGSEQSANPKCGACRHGISMYD